MSGVVGIYSSNESFVGNDELVEALYNCERFLGHRGEAGTGVMMVNGSNKIKPLKELGPVKVATPFEDLDRMSDSTTYAAVAHLLYSRRQPEESDIQPTTVKGKHYRAHIVSDSLLLGLKDLRAELEGDFEFSTQTNGEVIGALFLRELERAGGAKDQKEIAASRVFEATNGRGGYSVVMLLEEHGKNEMELVAFRDETGLNPACYGTIDGGKTYFVLSETYPLEDYGVGLDGLKELVPGSIFWMSRKDGCSVKQIVEPRRKHCGFDPVYFGGPEARILAPLGPLFAKILPQLGIKGCDSPGYKPTNFTLRACLGWLLKELYPDIEADMVVPIPETGKGVGTGISKALGLLYMDLLSKTHAYRTFQHPSRGRAMEVRTKLKVIEDWVFGKRILGTDDSIVKAGMSGRSRVDEDYLGGHSGKKKGMVDLIKKTGGASWLGLAISYSPMPFPCPRDFKPYDKREPLAAERMFGMGREEINREMAERLGADAVFYQSLQNVDGMFGPSFCKACTNGKYCVDDRFVYDWIKADLEMAEKMGLLY